MRPGVLGLDFDSLAMNLCGTRMSRRLVPMRRSRLRVRGLLCPAVRGPLVRQRSDLALARTVLARSSRVGQVLIVHTCKVPVVGISNQPG